MGEGERAVGVEAALNGKKRPADTKGRRMTGSAVKPARRIQEQGYGKDGREGGRESQDPDQQLQIRFHPREFVKGHESTNPPFFPLTP